MSKKKVVDASQMNLLDEIQKITQKLTPEQEAFIFLDAKSPSVILRSCAGSGKTFSCVRRLKELLKQGVDPSKMIFFSFTNAAVDELKKRVDNDNIRITTIHSFCVNLLAKMGKFKKISTFYDFAAWFKEKYKPNQYSSQEEKDTFYRLIQGLYDESEYISSSISAFKLQNADGIKCLVPPYLNEYNRFLRETKSRDFSDMLIEVRDLLKEDKWLKMFRNKYDYIFIDEYQDTSSIQLEILLSLNAKYYYLIGDIFQAIYGYTGSNAIKLEEMLKARRETIEMTLTVNFRSDKNIIENSNKYSSLKAKANSESSGFINRNIIVRIDDLMEILNVHKEVVVLVRTNAVIRKMEEQLLKNRFPMNYHNFITKADVEGYRKGDINQGLRIKLGKLKPYFENENDIISFIEQNRSSMKQIMTIHKSKGREFDYTVIVNSISPDILFETGLDKFLGKKRLDKISFQDDDDAGTESKNVHYVGVSRARHGLYYMIYE